MLRVDYTQKMGEFTFKRTYAAHERGGEYYTVFLYESNALGALIYEWEEDGETLINLHSFWNDEQHLKNCLGLSKGYTENIYSEEHGGDVLAEVKVNMKYKKARQIVTLLVKAFDKLKIELYTEEQEG